MKIKRDLELDSEGNTEKERILMGILSQLRFHYGDDLKRIGAKIDANATIKVGEVVVCRTSGAGTAHRWQVGVVDEILGDGDCVIKEFGSEARCKVLNECFHVITDIRKEILYNNLQHLVYERVRKAFARGGYWRHRFGGIDFHPNNIAIIWVREAFNGWAPNGMTSLPFPVQIPVNKKLTIKEILNRLVKCGYGRRRHRVIESWIY